VRLTILAVGGVRGPLGKVVADYAERADRYWRLRIVEVRGGGEGGRRSDPGAVLESEERRLRGRLPEGAHVVALTRGGRSLDSRGLAERLEELALRSVREVVFLLGGAYGLHPRLLQEAHEHLSLSSLTLPHEIARLVLLEQIYRAGTILRNEPYHKGP